MHLRTACSASQIPKARRDNSASSLSSAAPPSPSTDPFLSIPSLSLVGLAQKGILATNSRDISHRNHSRHCFNKRRIYTDVQRRPNTKPRPTGSAPPNVARGADKDWAVIGRSLCRLCASLKPLGAAIIAHGAAVIMPNENNCARHKESK